MAKEDFRRVKGDEQKAGKTIEVKSIKDIPEAARKDFMMRMLCIQAFLKARNAMWNRLSAASPSGRVKYI